MNYSTISESVGVQFAEDYCYPQDGNIETYYPDAIHLENGKIVFFDDTENVNYNNSEYQKVGYFKRGLFKGCASTCNYEVADRCIDVAKAFFSHYFGTDSFTNYGRHGVQYFNPTWVDDEGFSFDNRDKTILSGEVGKFFHSRTKRFSTGYELLLEKGFTMTTGPTSPREPILESQVGLYYGQDGIRSPYFNSSGIRNYLDLLGVSSAYTSTKVSESFFQSFVANENNLIKFFYENAGRQLTNENGEKAYVHSYLKNAIDYIRSCLGTGKIPSLSFDTIKDDPSVLGAVELLCKYCVLSNLMIVPFETARLAAIDGTRDNNDNYFPNPNFENTLLPILDGTSDVSSANIPDGWGIESTLRKGQFFTTPDFGQEKCMSVSNETDNSLTFGTKIYGLPAGEYDFSFYAKGDATVRLFLKKNSDFISQYYGGKTRFYATDQKEISTSDYQQYHIAFSIPEPHVNSYKYQEGGGFIINLLKGMKTMCRMSEFKFPYPVVKK